jgi:hypothetical protein
MRLGRVISGMLVVRTIFFCGHVCTVPSKANDVTLDAQSICVSVQ